MAFLSGHKGSHRALVFAWTLAAVLACVGFLGTACSSRGKDAAVSEGVEAVSDSALQRKDRGSGSAQSASGPAQDVVESSLLRFSVWQPAQGLVLDAFDWGKPLSSSNPGMDCRQELRQVGPPRNVYTCLVPAIEGRSRPVLVSVFEELQVSDSAELNRRLSRVVLDTRGREAEAGWRADLHRVGFRPQGGGSAAEAMDWLSADRKSRARFVWVPEKNALSLVFAPARQL